MFAVWFRPACVAPRGAAAAKVGRPARGPAPNVPIWHPCLEKEHCERTAQSSIDLKGSRRSLSEQAHRTADAMARKEVWSSLLGAVALVAIGSTLLAVLWQLRWSLLLLWALAELVFHTFAWCVLQEQPSAADKTPTALTGTAALPAHAHHHCHCDTRLPRFRVVDRQPVPHAPPGGVAEGTKAFQRCLQFIKSHKGFDYRAYLSGWFKDAPFEDVKRGGGCSSCCSPACRNDSRTACSRNALLL